MSGSDRGRRPLPAPDRPAGPPGAGALAIDVRELEVAYRTTFERRPTLKGALVRWGRGQRLRRTVHALRGIDLAVAPGAVLGLVGPNGAGKSTLLRAIAGIVPPSHGRIEVRGRVATLLRVGVGFHADLPGSENVVLGGLAAGLTLPEIYARYDAIVAFAGLGEFIDAPVRTYSSGMRSRLGFAVAAHLEPEVFLVDEALAAGDEAFRARCQERMRALAASACTIVLVSHSLDTVAELATEVVWLASGRVRRRGDPAAVIAAYRTSAMESWDADS